MVKGIKNKSYSERLKLLNLETLQFRRSRADMIQTFRIIKGFDKINKDIFFQFNSDNRTRGHSYKILKPQVTTSVKLNSFSQRVINNWNSLNELTVQSKTIHAFKTALKKEWKDHKLRFNI